MKLDELYQAYNGPVPELQKRIAEYGTLESYEQAFTRARISSLKQSFRDMWKARKSWAGYPEKQASLTKALIFYAYQIRMMKGVCK